MNVMHRQMPDQSLRSPDAEAVLANVADLVPWLQERAASVEQARRIPDDVAERLFETGLFALLRPVAFGGLGASPTLAWQATFAVAQGCSSCAWLAGLVSANIMMLGKFPDEAQEEVFAPGVSPIVPMLTGGVGYDIAVQPADGGITLDGKWRYASGIDVADWVGLLVTIPGPAGAANPNIVLVPKAEFVIDHASWRSMGMRGTGSKNVSLEQAFVPRHRFMSWTDLQAGRKHPTSPNAEPCYDFPLNAAFAMSVLAPTLGVATAGIEECARVMRGRTRSGNGTVQVDDKLTHVDVGTHAATMALLRDSLLGETESIERRVAGGTPLSPEERGLSRTKIAVASRHALGSAQRMFAAVGGALLPEGTRVERLFRDVHAMASHFLLQPEPIGELYGRLLLGLELPSHARL